MLAYFLTKLQCKIQVRLCRWVGGSVFQKLHPKTDSSKAGRPGRVGRVARPVSRVRRRPEKKKKKKTRGEEEDQRRRRRPVKEEEEDKKTCLNRKLNPKIDPPKAGWQNNDPTPWRRFFSFVNFGLGGSISNQFFGILIFCAPLISSNCLGLWLFWETYFVSYTICKKILHFKNVLMFSEALNNF